MFFPFTWMKLKSGAVDGYSTVRESKLLTFCVQIAFYAGSALLMQFKDQIATVTKKDFVPYSERRAAERQLFIERMEVCVHVFLLQLKACQCIL